MSSAVGLLRQLPIRRNQENMLKKVKDEQLSLNMNNEHVEGYRPGLFFFVYFSAVIKYVGCIDVGMLKVLHHEGHWTGLVVDILKGSKQHLSLCFK